METIMDVERHGQKRKQTVDIVSGIVQCCGQEQSMTGEKAEGGVDGVRMGASKGPSEKLPMRSLCSLGVEEHVRQSIHQVQTPRGGMHSHPGAGDPPPPVSLLFVCLQKQSLYFPKGTLSWQKDSVVKKQRLRCWEDGSLGEVRT